MNRDQPWSQMVAPSDGDFGDFLNDVNVGDFNDLDFAAFEKDGEILAFDGSGAAGVEGHFGSLVQPDGAAEWSSATAGDSQMAFATDGADEMVFEPPHQMQYAPQQHGPYSGMGRAGAVPPTPNSLELHGKQPVTARMDSQSNHLVYENHARKQQGQMVFTPLVSPAVTPLDTQFQIPEYAVPGEYFTPLTSPAMQAQTQHRSVYGSVRGSDTSEAASPSDMEIDTSPAGTTSTASAQKGKKAIKSKPLTRAVRRSPAMKPQRKKAPTSNSMPAKEVAEIMEAAEPASNSSSRPGSSNLNVAFHGPSASSSISPEPLSEILMPPPATPRSGSKGRSPLLGPGDSSQTVANSPATPATLMRIQSAGLSSSKDGARQESASVSSSSAVLRPNIAINTESISTPKLAPVSQRPGSVVPPSPSIPAGSSTPRPGSSSKKRTTSTLTSPALQPRISPNIKPLLPQGVSMSAETSTLLLASKSNYQNLLEGNHLPGVNYPSTLSANLTSKRTSHKLAEQGRRHRMNSALEKLAALLPNSGSPPSAGALADEDAEQPDKAEKSDKADKTGGKENSSSKANTVEMAIEYIHALQGELGSMRQQLATAEQRLDRAAGSSAGASPETVGEAAGPPRVRAAAASRRATKS